MRVVFVGASRFGLRCLELLHSLDECQVVGVVTAPEKFQISYSRDGVTNILHADVTVFAQQHSIPWAQIKQGMRDDRLFEYVVQWQPDAFLVAGWYHMVPPAWRRIAPAYGLHASLLPDYSGGAPLVWAIINGEKRTGITLFELADGVDDGPIVGQSETYISNDDTIATVYTRIEELGLELIRQFFPRIARGSAPSVNQANAARRIFPQRQPQDGLIDWSQSARRIHDFVRAQTRPYPGAFSYLLGRKVVIWSGRPSGRKERLRPGEVRVDESSVVVGCGCGETFHIIEATTSGSDLNVEDWLPAPGGRTFCFDSAEEGSGEHPKPDAGRQSSFETRCGDSLRDPQSLSSDGSNG